MGSMNNLEKFLVVLSISIIVIYLVFLGYVVFKNSFKVDVFNIIRTLNFTILPILIIFRIKNISFVGDLSRKYKMVVFCTVLVILVFAVGSLCFVFYETVNKLNSISSVASLLLGIFALVNFISNI